MNITIGGRGSGRTTELIKACAADKGSVIVEGGPEDILWLDPTQN